MISCDTECIAVNKKRADAEVSYCWLLLVASSLQRIVLLRFFSNLDGSLFSDTTKGDTSYVLMGFIDLFTSSPIISSNTEASSESDG